MFLVCQSVKQYKVQTQYNKLMYQKGTLEFFLLQSRLVDFDVYVLHVKCPYPHVIESLNVDFLHYNFAMQTVQAV